MWIFCILLLLDNEPKFSSFRLQKEKKYHTHDDLVELGEAVGIITGQSIVESGTRLRLRTFHIDGVFMEVL